MQLISVNRGQERAMDNGKPSGKTGIYKLPLEGPVPITTNGLKGDVISDKRNHGGPDQALYVYGMPDYAWWSAELQSDLSPGTFGENLTITELESASLRIGDRLVIGSVTLEVTSPRIPCITLARRMEDDAFVKRFTKAERPGVYCRVLQAGSVQVGDTVFLERCSSETVTVIELMRDFYKPKLTEAAIRRFLAAPIAIRARQHKEKQLQNLLASK
ncbi:MAG TPA: MOSC domain-containing protein [Chthonomonadaceae bacterium]|nr:MOSC domain-containing protein [Chthonomonadaceae bacterium]